MGITDFQRSIRKNSLGSSDMAAVMGLSPWRTAYDVWLEKTGQLEEQAPNASMEAGTMFEQGVLRYAEEQLGPIIRNQRRTCKDAPLAANIDALVVADGRAVEAKTAGLFGPLTGHWGEAGTDDFPAPYIIQCYVHMICCDSDFCHLAAFLGGRGFVLYGVGRDEVVANGIKDWACRFWDNHVVANLPPEGSTPSMDIVRRIKREPESVVEVPPVLVDTYQTLRQIRLDAAKREEAAKAELLAALGTAEGGNYGAGMVTYLECKRKAYSVAEITYRKLLIKEQK